MLLFTIISLWLLTVLEVVCADFIYIVASGDTLYQIASRFHVSLEALQAANPGINDPNIIMVGDTLVIPSEPSTRLNTDQPSTTAHHESWSATATESQTQYTIKSGDTLNNIAGKLGISYPCILKDNPELNNPDVIYPGDVINVAPCDISGNAPPSSTAGDAHTSLSSDFSDATSLSSGSEVPYTDTSTNGQASTISSPSSGYPSVTTQTTAPTSTDHQTAKTQGDTTYHPSASDDSSIPGAFTSVSQPTHVSESFPPTGSIDGSSTQAHNVSSDINTFTIPGDTTSPSNIPAATSPVPASLPGSNSSQSGGSTPMETSGFEQATPTTHESSPGETATRTFDGSSNSQNPKTTSEVAGSSGSGTDTPNTSVSQTDTKFASPTSVVTGNADPSATSQSTAPSPNETGVPTTPSASSLAPELATQSANDVAASATSVVQLSTEHALAPNNQTLTDLLMTSLQSLQTEASTLLNALVFTGGDTCIDLCDPISGIAAGLTALVAAIQSSTPILGITSGLLACREYVSEASTPCLPSCNTFQRRDISPLDQHIGSSAELIARASRPTEIPVVASRGHVLSKAFMLMGGTQGLEQTSDIKVVYNKIPIGTSSAQGSNKGQSPARYVVGFTGKFNTLLDLNVPGYYPNGEPTPSGKPVKQESLKIKIKPEDTFMIRLDWESPDHENANKDNPKLFHINLDIASGGVTQKYAIKMPKGHTMFKDDTNGWEAYQAQLKTINDALGYDTSEKIGPVPAGTPGTVPEQEFFVRAHGDLAKENLDALKERFGEELKQKWLMVARNYCPACD